MRDTIDSAIDRTTDDCMESYSSANVEGLNLLERFCDDAHGLVIGFDPPTVSITERMHRELALQTLVKRYGQALILSQDYWRGRILRRMESCKRDIHLTKESLEIPSSEEEAIK